MATGAEIGWDLDRPTGPTAADRVFYNGRLMADYQGDDGGSYQAIGAAGSIFEGLTLNFTPDREHEIYDAEYPDQMNPTGGSSLLASYSGGGSGGAAIQFSGGDPNRRVVVLGFPFKCITPETIRDEAMARILEFFQQGQTPQGWLAH